MPLSRATAISPVTATTLISTAFSPAITYPMTKMFCALDYAQQA